MTEEQKSPVGESQERPKNKLVGMTLQLNVKKSGLFVDKISGITLSSFGENQDKVDIPDNVDLSVVMRGISAGVLSVFDGKKDVTERFGGPKKAIQAPLRIVDDLPKKANKGDEPLMNLLQTNKLKNVVNHIQSLNNYAALERLEELEKMGNNPSYHPRLGIIEAIEQRKKEVSGIGLVREIPQDKADIIRVK